MSKDQIGEVGVGKMGAAKIGAGKVGAGKVEDLTREFAGTLVLPDEIPPRTPIAMPSS